MSPIDRVDDSTRQFEYYPTTDAWWVATGHAKAPAGWNSPARGPAPTTTRELRTTGRAQRGPLLPILHAVMAEVRLGQRYEDARGHVADVLNLQPGRRPRGRPASITISGALRPRVRSGCARSGAYQAVARRPMYTRQQARLSLPAAATSGVRRGSSACRVARWDVGFVLRLEHWSGA